MSEILLTRSICDDGLERACPISQFSIILGALFLRCLTLQPFVVGVDVVEPAINHTKRTHYHKALLETDCVNERLLRKLTCPFLA